jgi:hypothetical protein
MVSTRPGASLYTEESLRISRVAHDEWGVPWSLFDLGHVLMHEGDVTAAGPVRHECMLRYRASGIKFGEFRAMLALG